MTDDPIKNFLAQLLSEKGLLPDAVSLASYRYLANGHIDSLSFIKFTFRIEEHFGFRFSESDLLNDQIQTVGGLATLIATKLS